MARGNGKSASTGTLVPESYWLYHAKSRSTTSELVPRHCRANFENKIILRAVRAGS